MPPAFSYDVLSYPMKVFLQTHPDRLASQARLFGMEPPNVESCRVLELGCGSGGSLISYAFHLRDSQFVGVDLGETHIEDATRDGRALGLSNVDFRRMDVMDVTEEEFGRFDYIIAHGLFSWVPDFVQRKILGLCADLLTENGVGFVSYNAYPGSHYRQMVQSMLRYHAAHFDSPADKVGKAVSFLSFLAQNVPDKEVYGPFLETELRRHARNKPADVFHDDLSESNTAFYFHEFASMLKSHGLQYLAEAEIVSMGTAGFTSETQAFLESLEDVVEREQYMDFFRGRVFRQTLFCREGISLDRKPKPSVLNGFKIGSSLTPSSPEPVLEKKVGEVFKSTGGVSVEIDHPLTKAALVHLASIWGRSVPFGELLEIGRETLLGRGYTCRDWDREFSTARDIFLQVCLSTGYVELHVFQPHAETSVPEMPRINELARLQLGRCDSLTTLLNLSVRIESRVYGEFLSLSDGTRTRADLKRDLESFIKKSGLVEDKARLLADLDIWIDESLSTLSRLGMFTS
jgi:SAM-dependent methyltransferase